ncbi:hypothetical protein ONS96_000500 [Cadophora gregata f. sp. sojae]|nr:hypothetical protein ONS96_000500 [Cadophora gregata f. sp. sojae]
MSPGAQDFYTCGCSIFSYQATSTFYACQKHKGLKPRLIERDCGPCQRVKAVGLELNVVPSSDTHNHPQARHCFNNPQTYDNSQYVGTQGPSNGITSFETLANDLGRDFRQCDNSDRVFGLDEFVMGGGNSESMQVNQSEGYDMNGQTTQANNAGYVSGYVLNMNDKRMRVDGSDHDFNNSQAMPANKSQNDFDNSLPVQVNNFDNDISNRRLRTMSANCSEIGYANSLPFQANNTEDSFNDGQCMEANDSQNGTNYGQPVQVNNFEDHFNGCQFNQAVEDGGEEFQHNSPATPKPIRIIDLQNTIIDAPATLLRDVKTASHHAVTNEFSGDKQTILDAIYTCIKNGLAEATSLRDVDVNCERANVKHWIQDIKGGRSTLEDMEMGLFLSGEGKDLGRAMNAQATRERILNECMEILKRAL